MIPNTPGIYCIRNIVNNKRYIGSSVGMRARRQEHFRDLLLNAHHSISLQRAYNKYGRSNFVFEILMRVSDKNKLIFYEQKYIDHYNPEYNISKTAGSTLGYKMRKDAVLKNSIRNRGEGNNRAKINDEDIFDIINLSKHKNIKDISILYGVSTSTISRILNNKSFKHIDRGIHGIIPERKIYSKNGRSSLSKLAKQRRNGAKPIIVFDKHDNLIGEFPSCREFSLSEQGYNATSITDNLKRKNKKGLKYKIYHKGDNFNNLLQ